MRFHNLVETVLGKQSNISILRTLADHEDGLTGRQVDELAGLSHRAGNLSLNALVGEGVVKAKRIGKAILYTLAMDNILVASVLMPLLHVDSSMLSALKKELADNLDHPGVASIILYGSVVRGTERPNSDVDVCVIGADKSTCDVVAANEDDWQFEIGRQFGNQISLYCISRPDFIKRYKANDPLVTDIVESGLIVAGTDPKKMVGG
jgi:predicted nucleotidyltransferase